MSKTITIPKHILSAAEAERCRRDLKYFITRAWPTVEDGRPFVDGPHVDALCQHLMAVSRGEIRKLVINVPPRTGKSTIASILWPAWSWTSHPKTRWLFATYAGPLALRDAVRFRRLIESPWYQSRFGHMFKLAEDQNTKSRIDNDRGGYRISTSTGGTVTGDGGDIQVIDDAHNAQDALSDVKRQTVLEWWSNAWASRVNDPVTSASVVIGQRLHESDLPGHLLTNPAWDRLIIPAQFEPEAKRPPTSLGWVDWRTEPGELIWPKRYGRAEFDDLAKSLGAYGVAAQLQQRPAPLKGGLFQRSWWKFFDVAPERFDVVALSVDATFSETGSSYVVIQTIGEAQGRVYVLDQRRHRWSFTDTVRELVDAHARAVAAYGRVDATLVEAKANGPAIIDVIKGQIRGVIPIKVSDSKEARAVSVSPRVESGDVLLPRTAQWVPDFLDELTQFPRAANDDQVDALVQYVLWRAQNRVARIGVAAFGGASSSPWRIT